MNNYWLNRSETMERRIEKMLGCNVIWLDDPSVGRQLEEMAKEMAVELEEKIDAMFPKFDDPVLAENALKLSRLAGVNTTQAELEQIEAEGWVLDL